MNLPDPPVPDDPIRDEVRALDRSVGLEASGRDADRSGQFPWETFRALGRAHLLGLTIPEAAGGRGLTMQRAARALFELALCGGTHAAKLCLQPEFSSLLYQQGSPTLATEYFRPLLAGELLVGNQITEPSAGSDVAALAMTAQRQSDGYLLDGEKSQAAFAEDAHVAIVYARVIGPDAPDGITAFLVPQAAAGISRGRLPDYGERWMRRGSVRYASVRVPRALRLGEEGRAFEYLREELTHERALLGAIYLGVAWAGWDEAVRYAAERRSFGRPLSDRQAVAFPLVEDLVRLRAAWAQLDELLGRLDRGARAEADAALSKWYCGEVALSTADHAMQVHGGAGYSEELPAAQRYRDLRSARVAHGTDEILHHLAARRIWGGPSPGAGADRKG
ncbi:MAG: acyl-CoA dehydrogenase family protein [Thermoplasmata archaeon]